jgi:hypothetical protein
MASANFYVNTLKSFFLVVKNTILREADCMTDY